MPTLKLTGLLAYKNYFKDIATQHINIKGFKWGEKKVIENDNASASTENYLWAMPYENAQYTDTYSDNITKGKVARVVYLEVRDSQLFEDEDEQYEACEARMEEIIARILRDKKGAAIEDGWTMIATTIASWKTNPVEYKVGSTSWLGWELQMTFIDNTGLAFDKEKWNDTKTP